MFAGFDGKKSGRIPIKASALFALVIMSLSRAPLPFTPPPPRKRHRGPGYEAGFFVFIFSLSAVTFVALSDRDTVNRIFPKQDPIPVNTLSQVPESKRRSKSTGEIVLIISGVIVVGGLLASFVLWRFLGYRELAHTVVRLVMYFLLFFSFANLIFTFTEQKRNWLYLIMAFLYFFGSIALGAAFKEVKDKEELEEIEKDLSQEGDSFIHEYGRRFLDMMEFHDDELERAKVFITDLLTNHTPGRNIEEKKRLMKEMFETIEREIGSFSGHVNYQRNYVTLSILLVLSGRLEQAKRLMLKHELLTQDEADAILDKASVITSLKQIYKEVNGKPQEGGNEGE